MKKLVFLARIVALGLMHPRLITPASAYAIDGLLGERGIDLSATGSDKKTT